ncbi:HipA N-terminal domain-containing protein [Salmonirosea aquatica]|uniref:Phosphatidylinositol kinase n=1 Tax=Salmonirosea aquatica TaxID=2654236 RepID=A0A7C9BCQ5_9BACT|nr:phosphatidylinositol kinase [Cytophagaceae bacterium SJW1-29]
MDRAGTVYYGNMPAGVISEDEEGFTFIYNEEYMDAQHPPVSLTLPLRNEPYQSRVMFPFFDGLIPEGWLLDIAVQSWKLNPRDRMGLLLTVCQDCLGAVSVRRIEVPKL